MSSAKNWIVTYCRNVMVFGLSKHEAELAVVRRHSGAKISEVRRPVNDDGVHLETADEAIGVVEEEPSFDIAVTQRELKALIQGIKFYSEQEATAASPISTARPSEDEPSEVEGLIEKLEMAIPARWGERER